MMLPPLARFVLAFAWLSFWTASPVIGRVLESDFGPINLELERRYQHYSFCKIALPQLAASGPALLEKIGADNGTILQQLFDSLGEGVSPAERITKEKVKVFWVTSSAGERFLFVQPPPPKARNECGYVIFRTSGEKLLTYGLEIGTTLEEDQIVYFLVGYEFRYSGDKRYNLGPGWPTEPVEIVEAILTLKEDSEGRPQPKT